MKLRIEDDTSTHLTLTKAELYELLGIGLDKLGHARVEVTKFHVQGSDAFYVEVK